MKMNPSQILILMHKLVYQITITKHSSSIMLLTQSGRTHTITFSLNLKAITEL